MTDLRSNNGWRRLVVVALAILSGTVWSFVLSPASCVSAGTYNPLKAVHYADQWWNKRNPKFQNYGSNDCANYVSQCLIAGGLNLRVSTSADKSGSIPQATSLDAYLTNTLKATVWKTSPLAHPPTALQPGDVAIFGNWLGLTHAVFVTAKQSNGEPLFNAHTYDRFRTTLSWLFSSWTYVKYYHIVKAPVTVAVASKPPASATTTVAPQPVVTTRSSLPATIPDTQHKPAPSPDLASTLAPSSITSTSAVLNGVVRPDGQPVQWFFEYGESETYSSATDKQGPLLGNMTYNVDTAVTDLKPGTLYHVRVLRVTLDGSLFTGKDITFQTPETTKAAPAIEN